ncbi:MAG: TonB-dependent receptor plug domain-containing protein, partial [Pricia sp.]
MKNFNHTNVWKKTVFFLFLTVSFGLCAQEQTITGKITDADGTPLAGANVVQIGTSNGVVADFDGNYELRLTEGTKTLVFSYVGFKEKQIPVGDDTVVNATLEEDAQNLDEVVVVGYGSQKKTDITGSVSSVDSEDLEKAIFNNVDQLLQGRSAGVQVTSSSGEPGAPASIRIRGNNSISGSNSPLYVVDGIPITGSPNFNPQEIESLEVLKDASATAIYGSRGANGVILVTTKRGKSGKAEISFTQNNT